MKFLTNPTRDNKKQKTNLQNSEIGSGSAYIKEHAGHVEGYGENYPLETHSTNTNRPE